MAATCITQSGPKSVFGPLKSTTGRTCSSLLMTCVEVRPRETLFLLFPPYNENVGLKRWSTTGCWFHLPTVFKRRIRLFKERFEDEYPRTGPLGGDYISLQVSLFPPSTDVSHWAQLNGMTPTNACFPRRGGAEPQHLMIVHFLHLLSIGRARFAICLYKRFHFQTVQALNPRWWFVKIVLEQ
jgi:hypothetical protein